MEFPDFAFLFFVFLPSIFLGAIKNHSANYFIRILIRLGAPTASSLCLLSLILHLSVPVEILLPIHLVLSMHDTFPYAVLLLLIAWCMSYGLVTVGEKIGAREKFGLRYDSKKSVNVAKQELVKILDDFTANIQDFITKSHSAQLNSEENAQYLIQSFNRMQAKIGDVISLHQFRDKEVSSLVESHQKDKDELLKEKQTYQEYIDKLLQIIGRYETILSGTFPTNSENPSKEHDDESLPNNKLTKSDGIASRKIGHRVQTNLAKYLSRLGFECKNSLEKGKPDIIAKKDGKTTIFSCKVASLPDIPKRNQRTIYAEKYMTEINKAKDLEVPMVFYVENPRNNRRWAKLVSFDELFAHEKITTPAILARCDDYSAQACEEEFRNVLEGLGADFNGSS